jgi:hypothetical protein
MIRREEWRLFGRQFGIELVTRGVVVATCTAGMCLLFHESFGWPGWIGMAIGTALAQAHTNIRAARAKTSP